MDIFDLWRGVTRVINIRFVLLREQKVALTRSREVDPNGIEVALIPDLSISNLVCPYELRMQNN